MTHSNKEADRRLLPLSVAVGTAIAAMAFVLLGALGGLEARGAERRGEEACLAVAADQWPAQVASSTKETLTGYAAERLGAELGLQSVDLPKIAAATVLRDGSDSAMALISFKETDLCMYFLVTARSIDAVLEEVRGTVV